MSGYQALDIAAQNEEVAIIELFLSLIEEYGYIGLKKLDKIFTNIASDFNIF